MARAYDGGGFSDWFLPSKSELTQMSTNRVTINGTATANGGSNFSDSYYWSSTESDSDNAWGVVISYGYVYTENKSAAVHVRAVRAF